MVTHSELFSFALFKSDNNESDIMKFKVAMFNEASFFNFGDLMACSTAFKM